MDDWQLPKSQVAEWVVRSLVLVVLIMIFIAQGLPIIGGFIIWLGILPVTLLLFRIQSLQTTVRSDSVLVRNLRDPRPEIPIDQVEGVEWRPFAWLPPFGTAVLVLRDGSRLRLDASASTTSTGSVLVEDLTKALKDLRISDGPDRPRRRECVDDIPVDRIRSLPLFLVGGLGVVGFFMDAYPDPSPSFLGDLSTVGLVLVSGLMLIHGTTMLLTGVGIRFRPDLIYNGVGILILTVKWEKLGEIRVVGRGVLERVVIDAGPHRKTRAFVWFLRDVPTQNRGEWLAQWIRDERTHRFGSTPPS